MDCRCRWSSTITIFHCTEQCALFLSLPFLFVVRFFLVHMKFSFLTTFLLWFCGFSIWIVQFDDFNRSHFLCAFVNENLHTQKKNVINYFLLCIHFPAYYLAAMVRVRHLIFIKNARHTQIASVIAQLQLGDGYIVPGLFLYTVILSGRGWIRVVLFHSLH